MVTIKELAEICGVSVAAASKAMNRQKGIGAEKAEMVRAKAKELGYFPNAAARTMRTNRSRNIGILFRNGLAHEFFSLVLEAMHARADELGYDITFLGNSRYTDMGYYEHAMNRQCDGVIIAQGDFERSETERLAQSELPVVAIEQQFTGCTSIYGDNIEGMKALIAYLHEMGHRRIAFIHGSPGEITSQRVAGFYQGCRACGIDVPDEYVTAGQYRDPRESGLATRKLLGLRNRPTCILYPDDLSSLGGMTELQSAGLRIPEDMSCVGYDGIRLAGLLRPRLTTYRQDAQAIGVTAVEQLVSAIEDPKCYVPQTITVSGEIMEGDTVCRISM